MLQQIYIFIDLIIWVIFFIPTLYLFVFALASLKKLKKKQYPQSKKYRFAVLFPAYGSDEIIIDSVTGFFKQDYPNSLYDVVVISDHLKTETDIILRNKGAIVIEADFEQSSKAKALNLAMRELDSAKYDTVVILDIDNMVEQIGRAHV